MIVIFDTNIWKSNLYLRSPAAAALRFYLRNSNATVYLPEVIELEIRHHLKSDLHSHRSKVKSSHDRLLAIFGEMHELVVPSDSEIEEFVQDSIDGMGFKLEKIPFNFEDARKSMLRTIEKKPPSHNSQQFKDGVLWEHCKRALDDDDVAFVTDDKAFFQESKPAMGLSLALRGELKASKHSLTIFNSLQELLAEIRSPLEIGDDVISSAVNLELADQIHPFLERFSFVLGQGKFVASYYATEDPNALFTEIKAEYNCNDLTPMKRSNSALKLECTASYEPSNRLFSNFKIDELILSFNEEEGTLVERRNHYITLDAGFIGHRLVKHSIREQLE